MLPAPSSVETILNKKNLLVVVSLDFGELAMGSHFAKDLQNEYTISFLVPQKIKSLLPNEGKYFVYQNGQEMITHISSHNYDCIAFFSAYLLVPNHILTVKQLKYLINYASKNSIVFTSDPFLGGLEDMRLQDIRAPRFTQNKQTYVPKALYPVFAFFTFKRIYTVLKHLNHLGHIFPAALTPKDNYFSYFATDDLIQTHQIRYEEQWLFILSETDLLSLESEMGLNAFAETLKDFVERHAAIAKNITIIAPERLGKALYAFSHLPFKILSECDLKLFMQLVLDADRVFYWNMISHSLYYRIMNNLPVYFFQKGHLAEFFPALFNVAIETYYQGLPLNFIDIQHSVSKAELNKIHQDFCLHQADCINKIKSYPSARTILATLT